MPITAACLLGTGMGRYQTERCSNHLRVDTIGIEIL